MSTQHKIQGPRCQLLTNSLRTDIAIARSKASAMAVKLDAVTADKLTKSQAAVVISLLYDADKLLATIQENMGWT